VLGGHCLGVDVDLINNVDLVAICRLLGVLSSVISTLIHLLEISNQRVELIVRVAISVDTYVRSLLLQVSRKLISIIPSIDNLLPQVVLLRQLLLAILLLPISLISISCFPTSVVAFLT